MLSKLIKYEFKAMGRFMLPLYGLLIFAGAYAGVTANVTSGDSGVFHLLQKLAITGMIIVAFAMLAATVIMIVLVLQRFYRNLLGTEGYLMHTLPVTTQQNILSKSISSILWIALGVVAGLIAGVVYVSITGDMKAVVDMAKEGLDAFFNMTNMDKSYMVRNLALFIVIVFAEIYERLMKVYAAMSVGQLWGSHKIIGAVLSYFGFSFVELLISLIFSDSPFANAFAKGINLNGMLMVLAVLVLQSVIYNLIAWFMLDRKLNLT